MGAIAEIVTVPINCNKSAPGCLQKFPQIQEFIEAGTELQGTSAMTRVTPVAISLLDYKKGFGHTELFTV